jgi:hypothetical protein
LAWLHAPQISGKDHKPSRMQSIKDDGGAPQFPQQPPFAYLVDFLYSAGPSLPVGGGSAPLSHSELSAWQHNTGNSLSAWEATTLRSLSIAHIDQTNQSQHTDCPPPWCPEPTPETRRDISRQVQNALQTLMKTRPKK